ncbi:MAG: hypothetical protein IPN29_09425 [Saprospiraceae bacterium]|nr:hypothetical protein [Saprospiraceae bacterium]
MKHFFCIVFLLLTINSFSQSIFTNPISGTNPNTSNPYTTGQVVATNIAVSGIGRGSGISGQNASDRYNADQWNLAALDANDYFYFTVTPNAGYSINLASFVYTSQASGSGPVNVALRSSIDNYANNIGSATVSGTTITLSASQYQNISTAVTFRLYAWGGSNVNGTFSVNSFTFNGTVENCTNTGNTSSSGIFESYAVVGGTYYDLQNNTGNPDFQGYDLGSFNQGGTLTFSGGEIKTYKNSGDNFCGGRIWYSVYPAAGSPSTFNFVALAFNANLPNPGDQKWVNTSNPTNVLTALAPGNYKLAVYVDASGNLNGGASCGCTLFKLQNNANNYWIADFSVCTPPSISGAPLTSQNVCKDATPTNLEVTASGSGLTYQWHSNGSNSNMGGSPVNMATSNTYTPPTDVAGQFFYYCVVTGTCGTATSMPATVNVNALPIAVIMGTLSFCPGNSTTLTASGGDTYLWDDMTTNAMRVVNAASTFTVQVTDLNGCTDTESVTTLIYTSPTAVISGDLSICAGSSNILTASGGDTYLWEDMTTNAMRSVNTASTFTVQVTDINGCTDTESVTTSINALPVAVISGDLSICSGSSNILTASGGDTYLWDDMSTNAMRSVNTAAIFTVQVTDGNGCTDSESVTTTIDASPMASISGVLSFCPGNSTTLTASGGDTYLWDDMTTNAMRVVNAASTFTVQVTDLNGCTDTESVTTLIYTSPTAVISGDLTICAGSSNILTASGGDTYLWDNMSTNAMRSVNTASTFTVQVTDINGCTDTESVTTSINALPIAVISGDLSICSGSSNILTASGGDTYLWDDMSTNAMRSVNTAAIFTVQVTDGNGCTDSESVTTTIDASPMASISGVLSFCPGNSTTLTASGGDTYLWDDMTTNAMRVINAASTFTVQVTDLNGCTDTESVTTLIYTSPTAVISGDLTICAGSSNILTASGGDTYLWDNMSTNAMRSVNTASTFTVQVTDINGCTDSESVITTIDALPIASISGTLDFCDGSSTLLTADGGISFLWENMSTNAMRSVNTASVFTVQVTDINGCTDTESVITTINSLPVVDAGTYGPVCVDAADIILGGTPLGGSWMGFGTTGNNFDPSVGTQTLFYSYTDGNLCTNSDMVTITVNNLPTALISQTTGCGGGSIDLLAAGGTSFLWEDNSTNPLRTVTMSGTYSVTVTDANGCSDTESISANTGSSPIVINNGGCFTTVAAALAAAVSGDIIDIFAGTYSESFIVPEGVTLRINAGTAVFNAGGTVCNNGIIELNGGSFQNAGVYSGTGNFFGAFINSVGGSVRPGGC